MIIVKIIGIDIDKFDIVHFPVLMINMNYCQDLIINTIVRILE